MTSSPSLSPGLVLLHGNRAESLRDVLVAWMRQHPLAPLEREVILVQSSGIAQWLKLAVAGRPEAGGCGIAASLEFVLPSTFIWNSYRTVLGEEAAPETAPFDKLRLVWRLLRLLPDVLGEPVYAPLARFLADDTDTRKRYQLAERIADLYDQYQVYRADWLAAWLDGQDVLIDARGQRRALGMDNLWQAALWRRIRDDVSSQPGTDLARAGGRATVHAAFLEQVNNVRASPPPGLPRRVLVFGLSTLPRQSLEVLQALSRWVQVFVCVQNPCEHYWADSVSGQNLMRAQYRRQARKPGQPERLDETALHQHAHPLLAAWGRQGRDFIALLDEMDEPQARARHQDWLQAFGQRIDRFEPPDGDSLLAQIQTDILNLSSAAEIIERRRVIDPDKDTSLRFHIAHSPQREVEILHDQLLDAFARDPSLRPRDVVIMVPDIAAYAPHIEAVFGLLDRGDARFIPYSIADKNARGVDPLLNALECLLGLAQARLTVSEVLDLLDVPSIRQRFGLNESDLPQLHAWIRGANVRWGLHDTHRQALDLPGQDGVATHSWLFGLRRLLLGYASGLAAPAWQDIEPYGDLGGVGAAQLGPLIELLTRLESTWRQLQLPATPDEWVMRLHNLLKAFFLAESAEDRLTLLKLEEALQDLQAVCAEAGLKEALPLAIIAEPWLARLDSGSLSQRFFGGAVTFGTLMPMRAIPFRRVCLLGMQDGAYPRSHKPVDFDLMGTDYRPGDRSRREDDRYLFLEALLAARDALYLSWVGRSITDNSERPASVLVAQLRDHVQSGWRLASGGGEALLKALTVEHRLQPFSSDYVQGVPPYFTYAREWWPVAAAAGQYEDGQEAALPAIARAEPVSLDELANFLKSPVKAFMQNRLGVQFTEEEADDEVEPFQLAGLATWKLKAELIKAARAVERREGPEATVTDTSARWQRRGDLPPGAFAASLVEEWTSGLAGLLEDYQAALTQWPAVLEDSPFAFTKTVDGRPLRVEDRLTGLRGGTEAAGLAWVGWSASDLVDKRNRYRIDKILPHWVRHLAWHVARGPITTQVVSLKGRITLHPLSEDHARACFEALVQAWHRGMQRPLPLAVKTAVDWLRAIPGEAGGDPQKAHAAARKVYEPDHQYKGEVGQCPYLKRAYPDYASMAASGEFARLAEQLLRPVLSAVHQNDKPSASKKGEIV